MGRVKRFLLYTDAGTLLLSILLGWAVMLGIIWVEKALGLL